MFYFEEIFNNVIVLFRETYRIDKNDKTYVKSLGDDFLRINSVVEDSICFNEYEKMLPTIIYQTIQENYSMKEVLLSNLTLSDFEKTFTNNFYELKKLGYSQDFNDWIKDYQGWFDHTNKDLTLKEYFNKYNLNFCNNKFDRDQIIKKIKSNKSWFFKIITSKNIVLYLKSQKLLIINLSCII